MKSLLKNIFTTIIVIALLISVVGLQIYKHSCEPHKLNVVSIIGIPELEKVFSDSENLDDCCNIEENSFEEINCCVSESISDFNTVSFSSSESTCCVSSFESIQTSEILFSTVEKKLNSVKFLNLQKSFIDFGNKNSEQKLYTKNINLPPPLFGKQFLQSIHQLKLEHQSVS